jgi:hypothetical protein
MTITPGNLSMLLAIASSVAPGTWAIVAGILGAFVGYFGKQILKKYDRPTDSDHTSDAGPLPRRNTTRRARSPIGRKKNPPASRN